MLFFLTSPGQILSDCITYSLQVNEDKNFIANHYLLITDDKSQVINNEDK